eukprot:10663088-Ditylum_brightwellii.AAC.1
MTVHETVEQNSTWGLNRTKGWYLGPSTDHYRCYKVYIASTKRKHVALTVDFHTTTTKLPHISPAEAATHAVHDLKVALQNLPTNAQFKTIGALRAL